LAVANTATAFRGECYNTAFERCCNTGNRYDPGSQQCCPINGLQTLDIPCPCNGHADCSHIFTGAGFCCSQTAPSVPAALSLFRCDTYFNYPTGRGSFHVQPCSGSCIDLRYQTCCNGARCAREYEKCCNNECCNLFTATCLDANAQRFSSYFVIAGPGPRTQVSRCSVVENLHPIRAFWTFVLPSIIAAAALVAAAIIIVYANKTDAKWTPFEKVVFILMIVQLMLALPVLWSPIYRYAVLIIVGSLIEMAIMAAVSNVYVPPEIDRFLPSFTLGFATAAVIITQVVVLVGIINPVTGNALLDTSATSLIYENITECAEPRCTRAIDARAIAEAPIFCDPPVCRNVLRPRKNSVGLPNRDSGIWITTLNLYRREVECVQYYDYFQLDPRLLDVERVDNPALHTFGFCSPGYLLAILILGALLIMVGLVLLGFMIAGAIYELLPQIAAPIF